MCKVAVSSYGVSLYYIFPSEVDGRENLVTPQEYEKPELAGHKNRKAQCRLPDSDIKD
jgi:hypothetical protein